MPEILKVLELVNENRMAQVKIRRGGVKSRFDSERALLFDGSGKFGFQLGWLDDFNNTSKYQVYLLR